jgi:hypothetical protein
VEADASSDSITPSSEKGDSLLSGRREREEASLSEYEDAITASSECENSELHNDSKVDLSEAKSSVADRRGLLSLRVGKARSRSM